MKGDARTRRCQQARKAMTHAKRQVDWYSDRLVETGRREDYEAPYQKAKAELERCMAELDELEAVESNLEYENWTAGQVKFGGSVGWLNCQPSLEPK